MKKTDEPLPLEKLVSLHVMDAEGRLLGKVKDIALAVERICFSLPSESGGEAIRCISWKDVETSMSVSRFFQYFATHRLYSKGQVLVSEADGTAVGFAKLAEFHVRGDNFGCILGVAVHPQFRRKGIASTLVSAGTKRLKDEGAKAVFATVAKRNAASIAVLRNQGFRKIGFLALSRLFGWRIFEFYKDIRLGPEQIVLMYN